MPGKVSWPTSSPCCGALPRPSVDVATAAVALWSGLHGVVALRTAKPAYPLPPLEADVDAVVRPFV